ncbi:MAG TPA: histidine phosphatase family protein [Ktedonobacteraceae bacterium]|nr:histidine phosphatase family protein [Ktedonobacteraceae bacterium]
MTHLYIIRHGQAISAAQRTVGNTRLSPLGILQAERLRDRLAATGEIAADVLISSTLLRARHTAEIVAPALDLPIIFDSEIEEWRDPEEAEGQSEKKYGAAFRDTPFDQKPFYKFASNSESWSQFMLRVCTALNRITQEHEGKTIVLICHGGIVDASFLFFFGLSTLQFPKAFFNTRNTSITHWRNTSYVNSFPPTWVLQKYNDTMHLRDIDTPARIPWDGLRAQSASAPEKPQTPTEVETTNE